MIQRNRCALFALWVLPLACSGDDGSSGNEAGETSSASADTTSSSAEATGQTDSDTEGLPTCGNGVLDPGETCDGDCPETCDDGDACTSEVMVGAPATCDATCESDVIVACGDKEGCCPDACNTPDDIDCVDTDRDGLADAREGDNRTDPNDPDSDDDGFYDWDELMRGTDPNDPDDYPLPYVGLTPYGGDTHVHGATAVEVVTLFWGWNYSDCNNTLYIGGDVPHSHVWCDKLYDRARSVGLDWVNISHHDLGLLDWLPDFGEGLAYWTEVFDFWTQNPNYADPVHGDDPDYQYPTHPDGFPLWTEPGHTDSEWLSLQRCADFKNDPGAFLAFGGIEYTAQAGGDGCGPDAYCGGHKTVLYLHESDKPCAATYVNPDVNCNETELYEHIRETAGVANIAHPNWLGPLLIPHDPDTAVSGIDDVVLMGMEMRLGANNDLEEGVPGHDYRSMLDLGFRTQPVYGSDTHSWPQDTCSSSSYPGGGENGRRTVCWATGLTRGELIGGFLQHRCFYSSRGKPDVFFSIEARPMGSKLPLDKVADPQQGLHIVLDATRNDGHPVYEWDLIHNGQVVPAFTDLPCDASGDFCLFDGYYDAADLTGYYYIRLTDGTEPTNKRVITSPIWITP